MGTPGGVPERFLMLSVFVFAIQAVNEVDFGTSNAFLVIGVDDLNTTVQFFGNCFCSFLAVGVCDEISPTACGSSWIKSEDQKSF
jgi:hypothetical protein